MPYREVSQHSETLDLLNGSGRGRILFVCEHASNYIPAEFDNLGLEAGALTSHIAWDPGALELAVELSQDLDCPVAAAKVSRLVYDVNRSADSDGAIPQTSESWRIKGNEGLSVADREDRYRRYYLPFHGAIEKLLDQGGIKAIVTIHSFTPVYHNIKREVEIGILHDTDSHFADILLRAAEKNGQYIVRRNEPYGQADGVTHTLQKHAISRNLPNVMLEVRNDLLETVSSRHKIRDLLTDILSTSFEELQNEPK